MPLLLFRSLGVSQGWMESNEYIGGLGKKMVSARGSLGGSPARTAFSLFLSVEVSTCRGENSKTDRVKWRVHV